MEFGDFLIWFGLIWIGVSLVLTLIEVLFAVWFSQRMTPELRHIDEALETEQLIALTVEVDDNQYFCYNSRTKDFVCQGRNLGEIRERFKLRFPDKDAAIYNGDQTAVATLRAQLKELKEKNENLSVQ